MSVAQVSIFVEHFKWLDCRVIKAFELAQGRVHRLGKHQLGFYRFGIKSKNLADVALGAQVGRNFNLLQ